MGFFLCHLWFEALDFGELTGGHGMARASQSTVHVSRGGSPSSAQGRTLWTCRMVTRPRRKLVSICRGFLDVRQIPTTAKTPRRKQQVATESHF